MADPITNPNDYNPIIDSYNNQLQDLYNRRSQIEQQYAGDNRRMLGGFLAQKAHQDYQVAYSDINRQIQETHNNLARAGQYQQRLVGDIKHQDLLNKQAATAQAQQQKAAQAQQKANINNLEQQSAAAFGIGPKVGIQAALARGATYDPTTGQVVIPSDKQAKADKGDIVDAKRAAAQLKDNVAQLTSNFTDPTGAKIKVNPDDLVGNNALPYDEDDDGNRTYTIRGQNLEVPAADAKRLESLRDQVQAPVMDMSRTVDPRLFVQAQQQLKALTGDTAPDIVSDSLARQNRAYLAGPAVANALAQQGQTGTVSPEDAATESIAGVAANPGLPLGAFRAENLPALPGLPDTATTIYPGQGTTPSVDQTGYYGIRNIDPNAPIVNTDLNTTINSPSQLFQDFRSPVFRPGYQSKEDKLRAQFRQTRPDLNDQQFNDLFDNVVSKANTAGVPAEGFGQFATGALTANQPSQLAARASRLAEFLPLGSTYPGTSPITLPGQPGAAYVDATRRGVENQLMPALTGLGQLFSPDDLNAKRINYIQRDLIPPETTLEQFKAMEDQRLADEAANQQF